LDINRDARNHFVTKVEKMLGGSVNGKRIGILGLTFKPDTDDLRESPSLEILQALKEKGAQIQVFDPVGMEPARKMLDGVQFCADAYEAASGADAVLLLTAWNEFKHLDMDRLRESMRQPVLLDGRNVYDPKEMRDFGFQYAGVGRA
jgi:UDPglucose 6-dehydrogenase